MFVFGSLYLPVSICLCELMIFHNLHSSNRLESAEECLQVFHVGVL